jgi:hypothetical protein
LSLIEDPAETFSLLLKGTLVFVDGLGNTGGGGCFLLKVPVF